MAFEIKYDRNGIPIKGPNHAQLENVQEVTPQPVQTQSQENVQRHDDADSALAETLQTTTEEAAVSASPFTEATEPEQPDTPVQAAPHQNEAPAQRKEDHPNFRILKQRLEEANRERDEALRYAKQMQESVPQKQQAQAAQQSTADDDIDFNLDANDYVEPKHLNKFKNKIKNLEQQLQQQQQQAILLTTEARIKAQYTDFDKVVSKDNMEALRLTYPEVAETLNNAPDLYNKAVSAYTLIKQLGIAKDMMQVAQYDQDRERAQRNAAKPRPLISANAQTGSSPMSMANAFQNGLTDDLKAQLHKEMIEAKRNW